MTKRQKIRIRSKALHAEATRLGVPRFKDGNRLGAKKRGEMLLSGRYIQT